MVARLVIAMAFLAALPVGVLHLDAPPVAGIESVARAAVPTPATGGSGPCPLCLAAAQARTQMASPAPTLGHARTAISCVEADPGAPAAQPETGSGPAPRAPPRG